MQKLVFLFLLFSILSLACHKDELITCDCSKLKYGQLCQQFVFKKDKCIRYEIYTYSTNDSLATKTIDYPNSGYKETYTYVYNSNNTLQKQTLKKSNELGTFQWSYEYNDKGKIAKKAFYKGNKLQNYSLYEYNDKLQLAGEYIYNSGAILDTIRSYNYFTDDGIMRILTSDGANSIFYYSMFENYDNKLSKILFYDHNNVLQGTHLYKKNEQNVVAEIYYNDGSNNQVFREEREFNTDRNLIKRSCFDSEDNPTSYAMFKYSGQ